MFVDLTKNAQQSNVCLSCSLEEGRWGRREKVGNERWKREGKGEREGEKEV